MNEIVLILPYFGKLPNYFDFWLKSASYNKKIDFMIFTDQDISHTYCNNIKIKKISFQDLKRRISSCFEFKNVLNTPYKLCDYKPAYGLIFSEYLDNYSYWGHCDPDIIWGDIYNFIKDKINKYDRIYDRGHLCLYKNTEENNNLFKKSTKSHGINYRDVYTTEYSCHFDESDLIKEIMLNNNKKTFDFIEYADVLCNQFEFKILREQCNGKFDNTYIFEFDHGKLHGYSYVNNEIIKEEFCYLHLQKRKMEIKSTDLNSFYIVPNEFIMRKEQINKDLILRYSIRSRKYELDYFKMIYKMKFRNIMDGALIYRLKDKFKNNIFV